MYRYIELSGEVRVPPSLIGFEERESVHKSLVQTLEGSIRQDVGVILAIEDVNSVGVGRIKPEDAGIFYSVAFKALAFTPEVHELFIGEVVDITEFGAFINLGPLDGLCHVSQILDDFVTYDEKQGHLVGRDSQKTLMVGSKVLCRVIGVSLAKGEINKVNVTMRQPGLGAVSWIEADTKNREKEEKQKAEEE